jgi:hypothetical protein
MSFKKTILVAVWLGLAGFSQADLSGEEFAFQALGRLPEMQRLVLSDENRAVLSSMYGTSVTQSAIQYWRAGARSVWILQKIGKLKLIDAGFVVSDGRIESCEVLTYREKRGRQICSSRFLRQFQGALLTDDHRLSRRVDGISGATYSVNAMRSMGRAALYLDALISE